jgi:hypothetical protein
LTRDTVLLQYVAIQNHPPTIHSLSRLPSAGRTL